MFNADRVFGFAIVALSLLFLGLAVPTISDEWKSEIGAQYFTVGPTLFPYITGSITLFFGTVLALRPGHENNLQGIRSPGAKRNVLLVILSAVAYVALIPVIGFILGTIALLAVFLPLFGERRPIIVAAVAIAVPFVLHYGFLELFALRLPQGLLGLPS